MQRFAVGLVAFNQGNFPAGIDNLADRTEGVGQEIPIGTLGFRRNLSQAYVAVQIDIRFIVHHLG